jgi:hypothetical protein
MIWHSSCSTGFHLEEVWDGLRERVMQWPGRFPGIDIVGMVVFGGVGRDISTGPWMLADDLVDRKDFEEI